MKAALASGKSLSKELAEDEKLQRDFIYDESEQIEIDDEYSRLSGISDPKLLLPSHPSVKLLQFLKEIKLMFPNSLKLNRGNYIISDLVSTCNRVQVSDMILLHEHRGVPSSLTVPLSSWPNCDFRYIMSN